MGPPDPHHSQAERFGGIHPYVPKILRLDTHNNTIHYAAFTVVSPRMGANGWPFANVDPFPAAGVDPVLHAEHVKDLYLKADPNYEGRYA